jgi:hypothetical protein
VFDSRQIHAVDYPVTERPASVEEAVLAEAQYYIAMLARHQRARQNEDGDGENAAAAAADDDDDVVVIDVADLMSFTRLRQACSNDAELLRYWRVYDRFSCSLVHFLNEGRSLIEIDGLVCGTKLTCFFEKWFRVSRRKCTGFLRCFCDCGRQGQCIWFAIDSVVETRLKLSVYCIDFYE